jgi:hypothetical protein
VIGLITRLFKSDTRIPLDIPPRLRIWLAFGLGAVSSVLEMVVAGTPWKTALVDGLVSAVLAVVGHDVLIGSMRDGREFAVPGLMLPPSPPPSPKKPETPLS